MQTVWITGASSGIGAACALRYAAEGARLILTSSLPKNLEPVADQCRAAGSPGVVVLSYDLRWPDGIPKLVAAAWDAFGGLDIVFCNAGVSQRATVEETSSELLRTIMEIDYFAPVAITQAVLPRMLERGGGHIAVTTSMSGRFGFPLRSAYCSAKFALYGFFETLRAEYYDEGIRVTIVCPGRVRTNISYNALEGSGLPHGRLDPGQAKGIPAERAARTIVKAIRRSRREVLVGGGELLMIWIHRFFPGLCAFITRHIKPEEAL